MLDFADSSKLSSGEFSNIVNNPIWQSVRFDAAKVRALKFEADKLARGERMEYGDVEVR